MIQLKFVQLGRCFRPCLDPCSEKTWEQLQYNDWRWLKLKPNRVKSLPRSTNLSWISPARSASWCCVAPTHRVVFACRPHVDSHVDKRSRWTSGWIISWENNGRIVGNQGMISWDELSAIWFYCWAQWHGWPLGRHQMVLYPNGWPFFYVLGIWWLYKLWIWIDSGYTHV